MKKPIGLPLLKIKPINEEPQFKQMIRHSVHYVHGSTSASFNGLVKFRSLLCMEHIDGTPWFHGVGRLSSGERGYTIENCYKGEPISQGVSLNNIQNYSDSIRYYTTNFKDTPKDTYSVLYGIGNDIMIARQYYEGKLEHPVSDGSIGINYIKAIYVNSENLSNAHLLLQSVPFLASRLHALL